MDQHERQKITAYISDCLKETLAARANTGPEPAFRKSLYFSACDAATAPNVAKAVRALGFQNFDFRIVVFDGHELEDPIFQKCNVEKRSGAKWTLVKEYLKPESCQDYEFIFVWDSDVDILTFSSDIFLDLLRRNQVQLAQPALTRDSHYTWELTLQRPERLGRYTDFVEIMVPVFRGDIWPNFWSWIDPEKNPWGYGYDLFARSYCRLSCMAIVDSQPVRHLNPLTDRPEAVKALSELEASLCDYQKSCVMSYLSLT